MNVTRSLFKALVDAGITTCFANHGASEMQLVYEIGMTDRLRPILCLQEEVVTGAALGKTSKICTVIAPTNGTWIRPTHRRSFRHRPAARRRLPRRSFALLRF